MATVTVTNKCVILDIYTIAVFPYLFCQQHLQMSFLRRQESSIYNGLWIPAYAGMTNEVFNTDSLHTILKNALIYWESNI